MAREQRTFFVPTSTKKRVSKRTEDLAPHMHSVESSVACRMSILKCFRVIHHHHNVDMSRTTGVLYFYVCGNGGRVKRRARDLYKRTGYVFRKSINIRISGNGMQFIR